MKKVISLAVLAAFIISATYMVPRLHYNWLRKNVASQVVKITNEEANHGGTGFHVKTPSGKVVIMTNAHVCDGVKNDKNEVFISEDGTKPVARHILEISKTSDLCVVEPLDNKAGLEVKDKEPYGEIVYVVGHPKLRPITMGYGELTGKETVDVLDHFINPKDKNDKCDLPKQKVKEVPFFFWKLKGCFIHIESNMSNISILPGNSGSPLVTDTGKVIGVAYASSSDDNWGNFVKLSDVKDMLSKY